MSSPESIRGKRDIRIDSLRGLACILLVGYHVVGASPMGGLEIGDGLLRTLNDALGAVRMPLFTFLSGYVYALRPYDGDPGAFVLGKMRRLLLPMLIVGTAFLVVQQFSPGHHAHPPDWSTVHLLPVAHYWFLEALFLIFLAIIPLETFGLVRTRVGLIGCWIAALLIYITPIDIEWFAVNGAIYLMPFFLLGLYCKRFATFPKNEVHPLLPIATMLGIAIVAILYWKLIHGPLKTGRFVGELAIGTVSCLLLLWSRFRSEALAWIGGYSYTIYLLHVFFTAAIRVLLHAMHVTSLPVHILAGIAAGVFLPIVMDKLLSRHPITETAILGRR